MVHINTRANQLEKRNARRWSFLKPFTVRSTRTIWTSIRCATRFSVLFVAEIRIAEWWSDREYHNLLNYFRVHVIIIFIGIWYILGHLFRTLIYHWMKTKHKIMSTVLSSTGSTIGHIDNWLLKLNSNLFTSYTMQSPIDSLAIS